MFRIIMALTVGLAAVLGGCEAPTLVVRMVPSDQSLRETRLDSLSDAHWWEPTRVAVVDVDGVMTNAAARGLLGVGENPVSVFTEKLNAARHRDVAAVVLRLNSPGGTVAASELMHYELMRFRAETGKPVIACMLDAAASGGYYLACGADGIVAQPSTITGSIGTILQTVSFAGTMDRLGIRAEAITSGELKDLASPLRDLREEERQVLSGIVLQLYERFLAVVLAGRPSLTPETLAPLADGRVFTAEEALNAHLIDRIGYPRDAIAWAKELAGVRRAHVVMYHRPLFDAATVYAQSPADPPGALVNVELPTWLRAEGPQFLYLWQIGNYDR